PATACAGRTAAWPATAAGSTASAGCSSTRRESAASASGSPSQPEQRHKPLLVLGLDLGHHLRGVLEARAAELRGQQLVDLEDAGRVVHVDLDAHRLVLAGVDAHLVDRGRGPPMA